MSGLIVKCYKLAKIHHLVDSQGDGYSGEQDFENYIFMCLTNVQQQPSFLYIQCFKIEFQLRIKQLIRSLGFL